MILLRTTRMTPRTAAFAARLAEASGLKVVPLIDARFDDMDAQAERIAMDKTAIKALGLFAPPRFAWKCGDYGYYLARQRYDAPYYWMIEYDVRFSDQGLKVFFDHYAGDPADFLAPHLKPADQDWYWTPHAQGRDVDPWRCLFPITRLSARAVDHLLDKRRQQSRQPTRLALWPNDEAFVATSMAASGLECRDFNDDGPAVYDDGTLMFFDAIDGEAFETGLAAEAPFRIFHPVLYDEDYRAKVAKLQTYVDRPKRLKRLFNRTVGWINRQRRW